MGRIADARRGDGVVRDLPPPDHLQGRVSSAWLAQVMLSPSVGGVQAGLAARLLGPALGITVGAVVCLAGTAVAALALPAVRRATLPRASASPTSRRPGRAICW